MSKQVIDGNLDKRFNKLVSGLKKANKLEKKKRFDDNKGRPPKSRGKQNSDDGD